MPSVDPETLLSDLPASPAVYPHQTDPARAHVLLIRMNEADYRGASFLDDRVLNTQTEGAWAPLARVAEAARAVANPLPLHLIFHIGHVGSTLLSRLLDETEQVLSLREPLPLRSLAGAPDPALLEVLLRLWSRGFPSTRAVVVKATSSAARLAPQLLAARPEAHAVYLYLPAEPCLATLLAGENSPIDLNNHAPERTARLKATLGEAPSTNSLGELAAMSWLTERLTQAQVKRQFGARVLEIDFGNLLAQTETTLHSVLQHFGLDADATALARSPALTRYSKAPEYEYSPQFRDEILAQSRRDNAGEIQKGLEWLAAMAARQPKVRALLT